MLILLDEDVPHQVLAVLRHILPGHEVRHIHEINWSSKKDRFVYRDARRNGYHMIVTNDDHQMSDPDECTDVRRSGQHRVAYTQRVKGLRGLGFAVASIVAAMPDIVASLSTVDSQRLVTIVGVAAHGKRYEITDPRRNPPRYWS